MKTASVPRAVSISDIVRLPQPGMVFPGSFAFSSDDRWLAYLYSPEGNLTQQLFIRDCQSGEVHAMQTPGQAVSEECLSPDEILRRERLRERSLGVTRFTWHPRQNSILLSLSSGIYLLDVPEGQSRCLLKKGEKPFIDVRFSPDGNWISYVQDDELYVLPFKGGAPLQLTSGARGTGKTHGLAEYVAQEEMDRSHGYWWSPDSHWIAFTEVDETHIPVYRIINQGAIPTSEDHRYPFAGQPNAIVRLGVIPVGGGDPLWSDCKTDADHYLGRVAWLPDGWLVTQVIDRNQTTLDLYSLNPQSGKKSLLLREESPVWVNLHDVFTPLPTTESAAGGFLWASERSGFRHLYLYGWDGKLIRQLTAGEWQVDALVSVDTKNERIYFMGWMDDARQKHLYRVSLQGGEIDCLTQTAGTHAVVIDHRYEKFVDTFHSLETPPAVSLRSLTKEDLSETLFTNADPRLQTLSLVPPELISFTNRDGVLLYGAIYQPSAGFGSGPFPTTVYVYGGPHAQNVVNGWTMTVNMRAQYLASLGFLVFVLDNRGSARRGLEFEGAIRHRMGKVEVRDQVEGVQYLIKCGLADPKRVGIYGWSYGGYMSAMCLMQAPHVFKSAVAGAPVTHYDGYDTFYTERYMGTPQDNPQGYEEGSVLHYVERLEGSLMIIHGLIDENVHFRHTVRLINALIAADKEAELVLIPDGRHMVRKPADMVYIEKRLSNFFLKTLA